ncbi:hypothetical protein TRVL_10215 [Trypanosoma vivax]|nr:hypothetical protein TRVL_10215 [Trypanosoma vivax]
MQCGATLGEDNCFIKKREFIGTPFGHENGTVCLSQKTIKGLREAPALEGLTVADSERLMPRMMRATGVRGGALFEHYFSLKAVRRRALKLDRGLLQLNGGAGLPAHEHRRGKRWLWPLLGSKPFAPRRHRPTSAALVADVSMCGLARPCLRMAGRCVWRAARAFCALA